jgi:hypothetical protein
MQRLSSSVKFKLWVNRKVHEVKTGKTIEKTVEESLAPENLKIEIHDENGKWVESLGRSE